MLWQVSLSAVNRCAFKMQVWDKLRKNDSANIWDTQISVRYQCTYTSLRIQTRLIAQKVILFTVDLLQVSLFFTAGFCAFWDSCEWEEQVCGLLPLSFDNHNWWDVFFLTFYLKFIICLPFHRTGQMGTRLFAISHVFSFCFFVAEP